MKIALCQLNAIVGDVEGNLRLVKEALQNTANESPDLLVFPEMFLQGYPPQDLVENAWFIEKGEWAVEQLCDLTKQYSHCGLLVGLARKNTVAHGRGLVNAAVLIYQGKVVFQQNKALLPTYDVFDELRYFDPSPEVNIVPFKGEKLGITICEDIWNPKELFDQPLYDLDPVEELAQKGATIIINCSASPFYLGKRKRCFELGNHHASKHGLPFVFVNMIGANDELIFDGSSMYFDKAGALIEALPSFVEGVRVVDTKQEKASLPKLVENSIDEIYKALVLGVRDYTRKCGFKQVVLGLSGGIDSAVVCALAVKALGAQNVLGVSMPSQFSSKGSVADAEILAKNLGIQLHTVPIKSLYDTFNTSLATLFKGCQPDVTEENIQARIRGSLLMALSNKFNALLLSTGNKSESAVGYCTLYGDMNGGLSVISDLYKTTVYELARFINNDKEYIPEAILTKAPSAELKPDQKDQDTLPDYEVLDDILKMMLEQNASTEAILNKGYDKDIVLWIADAVIKNEYKRRQAAPGLKITKKAFGLGRRFPIAAQYRR